MPESTTQSRPECFPPLSTEFTHGALLQGPLKTLDSDCSKEEKQYAEWVTVRARVALLEASFQS